MINDSWRSLDSLGQAAHQFKRSRLPSKGKTMHITQV
jgi:hypothetical protein